MNYRPELEREIMEIVVDYHLNADLAITGKIEHYPSIVETINKILALMPGKEEIRKQEMERIINKVEEIIRVSQTRWNKAQFGAVLLNLLQALKEGK